MGEALTGPRTSGSSRCAAASSDLRRIRRFALYMASANVYL